MSWRDLRCDVIESSERQPPQLPMLPMQIVTVAMMVGIALFTGVGFFMAPVMEEGTPLEDLLLPALGGLALLMIAPYAVLRAVLLARARRLAESGESGEADASLFPVYNTLTLLGSALVEGFGLFGAVIFLLTRRHEALAAPALAIVLLVLRMPSREGYRRFRDAVLNTNPYRPS